MGNFWRMAWLYLRIVLLLLIIGFALTMFFINMSGQGPARILPWMDRGPNVLALLVAFVLGVLLVPLTRTIARTWHDYRGEKQRRHDDQAEAALRRYKTEQRALDAQKEDESQKQDERGH